jgi:hypothetical protein
MLRKLLVRGSAGERIQEWQPKNNPFTGTELIWNPWFFQFNEVTPENQSPGSNSRQFRPTELAVTESNSSKF